MGGSINGGTPKWMVSKGKSWNTYIYKCIMTGGTLISGNPHIHNTSSNILQAPACVIVTRKTLLNVHNAAIRTGICRCRWHTTRIEVIKPVLTVLPSCFKYLLEVLGSLMLRLFPRPFWHLEVGRAAETEERIFQDLHQETHCSSCLCDTWRPARTTSSQSRPTGLFPSFRQNSSRLKVFYSIL